jgi:DNA-binding response OmpR family regulator
MKNIVILDDSLTIHKIVEYSIDPDKYKLYKIFTIEDFNNKLKEIDIHLLLLDNKLDGLNVKEFCNNLKKNNRNLKIILLVGAFEKLSQEDLAKLNVDDVINKPFNSKILFEKIESLMGGKPTYMEKTFEGKNIEESESSNKDIEYEKLLEELEPITLKKHDEKPKKHDLDESDSLDDDEINLVSDEEKWDFINDDGDIKDIRDSFKSLEDIDDLKSALEKKLKEDLESIDFTKTARNIIEAYIKEGLEGVDLEQIISSFVEDRLNTILSNKLEEVFENILDNAIQTIVPHIAEKLIKEEIEKIKKGKSE